MCFSFPGGILMVPQKQRDFKISRFYIETNILTRRSLFSNFLSVSTESAVQWSVDADEIIAQVESHILFSFVKLKTKADVLFAIRLEHAIS